MKRKAVITFLLFLLLPGVFLGVPLLQRLLSSDEQNGQLIGTPVELGNPDRRTMQERARYSGSLIADRTASVVSRQSGEIVEFLVRENETVEVGDTLARIEDNQARLELEQARANLSMRESQLRAARSGARVEEIESARADVQQAEQEIATAESDLERTRRLHEAGTISRSSLEEAENSFRRARTELENARRSFSILEQGATDEEIEQAESAVRAAERQLDLAELSLSYTSVRSPVSGRVTHRYVETGNTVERGTPIARVVNDNLIRAIIRVPERRYGAFTSTQMSSDVRLRASAYPDIDATQAVVTRVGSSIDSSTRTFEVEVAAENRGGALRPGMYVEAEFVMRERENALSLPDRGVVNRAGRFVVFLFDEESGRVRELEIQRGLRSDGFTEIIGDLSESDSVVVRGNSFLADRQNVRSTR